MHKKTWSDYSFYLSANHLIAGFTNQDFQYSATNDRAEFAKILKLDSGKIVIPKQIHSNNVTICTEAGKIIDADGIIANNKDLILQIYSYCNTGGLAHYPKDGSTSWNELKGKIKQYLSLNL